MLNTLKNEFLKVDKMDMYKIYQNQIDTFSHLLNTCIYLTGSQTKIDLNVISELEYSLEYIFENIGLTKIKIQELESDKIRMELLTKKYEKVKKILNSFYFQNNKTSLED